jgi:hypothetical protein
VSINFLFWFGGLWPIAAMLAEARLTLEMDSMVMKARDGMFSNLGADNLCESGNCWRRSLQRVINLTKNFQTPDII